jgi:hypothetical protein
MVGRETHPVIGQENKVFLPVQGGTMNKFRAMIFIRILALIVLALFLPGCLGNNAKKTGVPTATLTVSEQGEPAAVVDVTETSTMVAEEVSSPTADATEGTIPTETAEPVDESPVEATPVPAPTSTEPAIATDAPAAAPAGEDVYEPIPGCARSRLHWGDVIRISPKLEYVRIRSTADTHPADNIVRRLYRSELAQTTGLPVCNYGWILWPIRTADGTLGWVPESDGTTFWLVNVNGSFFPTATLPSR